jgi:hypothetical protein
MSDYPDFCDAYIEHAEFIDGTELNDDELNELNDEHADIVYEAAASKYYDN